MFQIDGLWWLLFSLGPLFLFQRSLHKELQEFFLLLTRRRDISLVLFSVIFLPGVFLHEISHFLMAKLLRVKTGKFSLIPQNLGNGRLRLGYVETEEVEFIRDALIGLAPLLTGMLFLGFIGKEKLGFLTLWDAISTLDIRTILNTLKGTVAQPNYWVWFYASVSISSTMMPSASDRRAWIPLLLAVISIVIVGIVVGFGPILLASVIQPVNNASKSIALVFAFSTVVQLVVLIPIMVCKMVISKITRVEIKRS